MAILLTPKKARILDIPVRVLRENGVKPGCFRLIDNNCLDKMLKARDRRLFMTKSQGFDQEKIGNDIYDVVRKATLSNTKEKFAGYLQDIDGTYVIEASVKKENDWPVISGNLTSEKKDVILTIIVDGKKKEIGVRYEGVSKVYPLTAMETVKENVNEYVLNYRV